VVKTLLRRIETLAAMLRYEDAAAQRDRLAAFIRAAARGQRLSALAGCAQLVAARPTPDHGYEVVVVRHGRLAATGTVPPGAAPRPYVDALIATAETVVLDSAAAGATAAASAAVPTAAASADEIECVLRWLDSPGVRLVEVDGSWSCPAHGAGGQRQLLDLAIELEADPDPFADRRGLRPVHRPARAS
jgi:DNA polymerase-3 subunit epsilon